MSRQLVITYYADRDMLGLVSDEDYEAFKDILLEQLHKEWPKGAITSRIVGHDEQAIWTPAYTPERSLWGTVGRKVDPTGRRPDGRPIIDLTHIKHRIIQEL